MCDSCAESPEQPRSNSVASQLPAEAAGYDSVQTTDTVQTENRRARPHVEASLPSHRRPSNTTGRDLQHNASQSNSDQVRYPSSSSQLERLQTTESRLASEPTTASNASISRLHDVDSSSPMTTSHTRSTGGSSLIIFETQIQRIEVHGDSGLKESERSELGDHLSLQEMIPSVPSRTTRPKAFETTRELRVCRERTLDKNLGHIFWLPISDFLVQRAGMRILLSYSDCNHKENVGLTQGQTIYDFTYRPQKQNRALLFEFRSESDACDFGKILMRPFGNLADCRYGKSLDLRPGRINAQWRFLDRSAENEEFRISRVAKRVQHFTCHQADGSPADRGVLISGHEEATTAQVFVYWLGTEIDMSIDDDNSTLVLGRLHFAEYMSDARDLTFAQTRERRGSFACAELHEVSALTLRFNATPGR